VILVRRLEHWPLAAGIDDLGVVMEFFLSQPQAKQYARKHIPGP